jgi:Holliday junction resolvasome RuvABC endonuclease subunit
MSFSRLIAIDPSLTSSGWALFEVKSGTLLAIGKICSLDATHSYPSRLRDIQEKIKSAFNTLKLSNDDILISEAPTRIIDPHASFKVEQVRSMFETLGREFGLHVPGRINPRTVHKELLGMKGKQLKRSIIKEAAVYTVEKLYTNHLRRMGFICAPSHFKKHQDIVDAILIGHTGVTRIRNAAWNNHPLQALHLEELFSERSVRRRHVLKKNRSNVLTKTVLIGAWLLFFAGGNHLSYVYASPEIKNKSPHAAQSISAKSKKRNFSAVALTTPNKVTLCSQNLAQYGTFQSLQRKTPSLSKTEYEAKENGLIKRFSTVDCDIIAVQEIIARSESEAEELLGQFSEKMRRFSGRKFKVLASTGLDPSSHTGFIIAESRAEVMNAVSYATVELPKLNPKQKPRFFLRAPLEVQLKLKNSSEDAPPQPAKLMTLINIHFKSKRGAQDDPAALEWETVRMEMAEAVRRIIEKRHANTVRSADEIMVVLGDRNSEPDSASARILEGRVTLSQFREQGSCRLSKRGVPLCKTDSAKDPLLLSILTTDPQTKYLPGTFHYKKDVYWLDDILLTLPSLRFAWKEFDKAGDFDSGIVQGYKEASDHAMVYAILKY